MSSLNLREAIKVKIADFKIKLLYKEGAMDLIFNKVHYL